MRFVPGPEISIEALEKSRSRAVPEAGVPMGRRSRACNRGRAPDQPGRISDLLKFLVPKVGESFVLGHNVESQEVAQARPRPELAGALETILELAAL